MSIKRTRRNRALRSPKVNSRATYRRLGFSLPTGQLPNAIELLEPLVWYDNATLNSNSFWANSGTLGADYDLDTAWGGGGTIVDDADFGISLRSSTPAFSPGGLRTLATSVSISPPYTIGVVYNILGAQLASQYVLSQEGAGLSIYTTNTPTMGAIATTTALQSPSTNTWSNTPNYVIAEWDTNLVTNKGKYVAQQSKAAVPGNWNGIVLGASNTISTFNVNAITATLVILQGKKISELEAALIQEFPVLGS